MFAGGLTDLSTQWGNCKDPSPVSKGRQEDQQGNSAPLRERIACSEAALMPAAPSLTSLALCRCSWADAAAARCWAVLWGGTSCSCQAVAPCRSLWSRPAVCLPSIFGKKMLGSCLFVAPWKPPLRNGFFCLVTWEKNIFPSSFHYFETLKKQSFKEPGISRPVAAACSSHAAHSSPWCSSPAGTSAPPSCKFWQWKHV